MGCCATTKCAKKGLILGLQPKPERASQPPAVTSVAPVQRAMTEELPLLEEVVRSTAQLQVVIQAKLMQLVHGMTSDGSQKGCLDL